MLVAFLLLVSVLGTLRAEEPGPWYLISETELRSIEHYRKTSEAEKQTWLSQAKELKTIAGNSETRSARLEVESGNLRRESETLNSQLADQREQTRMLQRSFNEYEAGQLTLISLKNGEIADLKQAAADKALEAESHKGKAVLRLAVIIVLLAAIAGYAVFKVCRFFRLV
jgi:hypothetical protein